ncbi:putative Glutaredoxin domain-containing cysteine-rich protein [Hypsibius exemplaris]|uniref:Glutaredoxin domain-containing cysteine-rich protein n=1 Tax=Hypsibius exemplaris TaxID=2072580 RepID=A0A1W0WZE9_HYPEX|nr:putative Glutaredoxin domain-containing cysteine-rich protein [Hypsibius exemplaris]
MWKPRKFTDAHAPLRKLNSSIAESTTDSDRETDSSAGGHAGGGGGSCGDFDETASDSLSFSEVRSEISLDDMRSNLGNAYEYDHLMRFHCEELLQPGEDENDDEPAPLHRLDILEHCRTNASIVSRKGSTRGVRGRVRAAIATFKDTGNAHTKNYQLLERGRVTLYTTSLAICRGPFFRCLEVRKVLQNLMIKFSDCDLYVNRDYQAELKERIGAENADRVPHLFVEGHYVGDFETILNLNESGQLRTMLKPYKRAGVVPPCQQCGGFTVIPCLVCSGSKKSTHRNAFTDQFYALRCSTCSSDGLQQCPLCTAPTTTTTSTTTPQKA